jgi:hypothetical protein
MEVVDAIRCAFQPLSISFHPSRNILASGLVGGRIEGTVNY